MNYHAQIHYPPDTVSIRGEAQAVRQIVRLLPQHTTVQMQKVEQSPLEAKAEVDFAAQLLNRMATGKQPVKTHLLTQLAGSLAKAAKAI